MLDYYTRVVNGAKELLLKTWHCSYALKGVRRLIAFIQRDASTEDRKKKRVPIDHGLLDLLSCCKYDIDRREAIHRELMRSTQMD